MPHATRSPLYGLKSDAEICFVDRASRLTPADSLAAFVREVLLSTAERMLSYAKDTAPTFPNRFPLPVFQQAPVLPPGVMMGGKDFKFAVTVPPMRFERWCLAFKASEQETLSEWLAAMIDKVSQLHPASLHPANP